MTDKAKEFTPCKHVKDAGRLEQLPTGQYHCQRCVECGQLLAIQRVEAKHRKPISVG